MKTWQKLFSLGVGTILAAVVMLLGFSIWQGSMGESWMLQHYPDAPSMAALWTHEMRHAYDAYILSLGFPLEVTLPIFIIALPITVPITFLIVYAVIKYEE